MFHIKGGFASLAVLLFSVHSMVAKASGTPPLEQASASIFQVEGRVRRDGPWIEIGTGFLVDADGWAFTSYHVARRLLAARCVFEGNSIASAELWAVWPEYDLALLRLEDIDRPPLPLASGEPSVGDDVWAAGYSQFGYTVTKGIINGSRRSSDMSSVYGWPRNTAADSVWLQTDCTINPGNSGGPLLNARGEVIGINTWKSLLGDNMFFALSAAHLPELLRRRPSEPVSFAAMVPELPEEAKVQVEDFSDLPSIDIEQTVSAGSLRSHVRNLTMAHDCPTCRGTGTTTRRVQRGWHGSGTFRRANMVNEDVRCSRCKGSKLNDRAISAWLNRIADAYVRVDATHPRMNEYMEAATEQFREVMRRTPAAKVAAASSSKQWAVGDIVIFCASGLEAVELPGLENPVQLLSSSDHLYILRDTRHVFPRLLRGSRVVAGGVLVGWLNGDMELPIIQHGFVVDY